jgi:hypothetical protein
MAVNQIAYFPNPLTSKSVGAVHTTATTTTIYTVGVGEIKKASSFLVSITVDGGVGDGISGVLKIGTAQFAFSGNVYGDPGNLVTPKTYTYGSKDVGYDGSFLQVGDTITLTTAASGTAPTSYQVSAAIALDEYTA